MLLEIPETLSAPASPIPSGDSFLHITGWNHITPVLASFRRCPDVDRPILLRVSGELGPLMPFLAIGMLTSVGRHTTAGLGRLLWEAG